MGENIGLGLCITFIVILLLGCMYSCARNEGVEGNRKSTSDIDGQSKYVEPNIKQIGYNSSGYSYLVDENTGVVYMEYEGVYAHAITVMFNADGTVMTEKDILNNPNVIATPTDSEGK